MIRFTSLPDPSYGIPYVNTDFTSVLQDEHIKAYASILDGINQGSTSSADALNSGIILSGCDILLADNSKFIMGFTNSVVYIDGEFYQNDPTYTGTITISSTTFYIVPGATTSELRTLPVDDTTTATASHTRYFVTTDTIPSVPHIKFLNKGTSRYYKRILKYFTSRVGDVYMTKSKSNFDGVGIGFNDMEGFVILDNNSGINGLPDLSGRFIRGVHTGSMVRDTGGLETHSISEYEVPKHEHSTGKAQYVYFKYYSSQLSGYGGGLSAFSFPGSGIPQDANFNHHHVFNTSLYTYNADADFTIPRTPTTNTSPMSEMGNPDNYIPYYYPVKINGYADNNTGSMFAYFNRFMNSNYLSSKKCFTGGIHGLSSSNLQSHRHGIKYQNDSGQSGDRVSGDPHENRPPYCVVVYYTKK